jgi:prolyl-tRNA synthetase
MPVDGLCDAVVAKLDAMQADMLAQATARRDANVHRVASYDELKSKLDAGGFFLVPWHDDSDAEAKIKEETKATIRCYPLDGQAAANGQTCFYSGKPATHMAIFARAY